jgi:hypothetical protein
VALSGSGGLALVGGPGAQEDLGGAWVFEGVPTVHKLPGEEGGHGTGKEEEKQEEKHEEKHETPPPGPTTHEELPPAQTVVTPKTGVLVPSQTSQPPVVVAAASCKLVGSRLTVSRTGHVSAELACSGNRSASGKLTLTVTKRVTRKAGGKSASSKKTKTITQTITIASVSFTLAPNKTTTATLLLTKTGRALLSAGHGRLSVAARLAKLLPAPAQTRTATVQLVLQKPASKNTHKK